MDTAITQYRVHQCSTCTGDTYYYCESCPIVLCPQCKENHVIDLKTIDHDVVSYLDTINCIPTQEICMRHTSKIYEKFCKPCHVPLCVSCTEEQSHRFKSFVYGQGQHRIMDIKGAYKEKREQHRGTIHNIRSEVLFYRSFLLSGIKADFKTCHKTFSSYQSDMLTKSKKLKRVINLVKKDFMYNVFCAFDFKHRCLKQKIEMGRHIVSLQEYDNIYVQPAFIFSALQFLSSIKKALPQKHLTLHTSLLSITESLNKEDVMESLSVIRITERGNRRVGIKSQLKLLPCPEFFQSFTLTGIHRCFHISCVTSDLVWVIDRNNLILTNTTGVIRYRVEDLCSGLYSGSGLHTVNSENELIYIDRNYNINKLSNDMKTTSTFIKTTYSTWKLQRKDSTWRPLCLYWSLSTRDLLVGMFIKSTGKVTRYDQSGKLTQTIQHDHTGLVLYRKPIYITENNYGDVVVAECDFMSGSLVVTDRGGRHRFSYTGHPSGSELWPRGICTDALSHILVCDDKTKTVQMLNKDGQFLSYLLTKSQEMGAPYSLSYDVNTHRLLVGSWNNKVCVYSYITRQDALTDQNHVIESLGAILSTGRENAEQGKECLLKLMSRPKLHHAFTIRDVRCCYHISCVTSDRFWISDKNDLILTNTTGVTLHRVKGYCNYLYGGLHTFDSKTELTYIDRNFNINKLSMDLKTTTTFKKRKDSIWKPVCVYCSPSTGDLLVGMCYIHTETGKVTRHDQSGQQTQTLQLDSTGRGLYRKPIYITENNNGDVVVSDSTAVVVTERRGRHRFSYTGHPSGSELLPCGICTDALSHILVCDDITETVQMLSKDGQFLSYLLSKSQEMGKLKSLSYDVKTHCLLVGSLNKKVFVYRYITRQDTVTDVHSLSTDRNALSCLTPAREWL